MSSKWEQIGAKSKRLTDQNKWTLKSKAQAFASKKVAEKRDKTEAQLQSQVAALLIPADIRKKLEAIPAKYLHRERFVRVVCESEWYELEYKDRIGIPETKGALQLKKTDPAGKTLLRLKAEIKEVKRIEQEAASHVLTILAGANTTKQLIELWPEAHQVWPELFNECAAPTAIVPADTAKKLNALLGIKPKRAA